MGLKTKCSEKRGFRNNLTFDLFLAEHKICRFLQCYAARWGLEVELLVVSPVLGGWDRGLITAMGLAVRGEPGLCPCRESPAWEFITTGTDEALTTNPIVKHYVVTKPSFYWTELKHNFLTERKASFGRCGRMFYFFCGCFNFLSKGILKVWEAAQS